MRFLQAMIAITLILLVGCAQVPKEAVELSATVGRDLAEMKKSHVALVKIHFEGLIKDMNHFIDNVYLPYQIQQTLSDEELRQDMILSLNQASRADSSNISQLEAFEKLKTFHLIIIQEVEDYRKEILAPTKEKYESTLNDINTAYEQIHYANSIVTGHLASIVKVHDIQNDALEKFDLKDLRENIGKNITKVSDKVSELTTIATDKNNDFKEAIDKFEKIAESLK